MISGGLNKWNNISNYFSEWEGKYTFHYANFKQKISIGSFYNYSMNTRRQSLRIKPKISVRFWVVMNEEILPQCATLQARAELPRPTEEWADGWQILAFGVTHFSWTERKNVSHKGKNWLCVPSIHNVQVCGNTRYFIAKLEGFIVFVTDIIGMCSWFRKSLVF